MLIINVKQNGLIFKTVACRNRSDLKENQMESFQICRKLCVLPQNEYDETLFFGCYDGSAKYRDENLTAIVLTDKQPSTDQRKITAQIF
jgi:hypothetical protein